MRISRGGIGRPGALSAAAYGKLPSSSRRRAGGDAFTIVGVVGKVKQAALTDDAAQGDIFVIVRTSLAPESLALTLQRVTRQVDPHLPLNGIRSMDTRISSSLVTRRWPALLAGLFSAIPAAARDRRAHGTRSPAGTDSRPVFLACISPARGR